MKNNKLLLMTKKIVIFTFIILSGWIINTCATKNHAEKIYNVGIVSGVDPFSPIADGFKTKLKELGYIEGRNITYDFKKFNGDEEGVRAAIQRFVTNQVDLIFAFPTEPAVIAKAYSKGTNIPVVFAMAGIEGNNLIDTVPQPGDNITGVRFPGTESTVKRLEILHELVPKAKRIFITYDINYPTIPYALAQLRTAASLMEIELIEEPVINLEQLRAQFQKRSALSDVGADAILTMPDMNNNTPEGFGTILEFSKQHRLPVGGGMDHTADLGALFSFVPDKIEMGSQAAIIADKIFKGTPAGAIMVVTPDCYLRLNYKAIQNLGLTVSDGLLSRAKEIIN